MRLRDPRGFLGGLDAGGDRRPAGGGVKERQLVRAEAEDGDAEGLERLGGRADVEQRLGPGADDERRRTGELGQVGRDVWPLGEAAVDAADPAGPEEADSCETADGERAADGRRPESSLRRAGSEIPRAGLAGGRAGLAEAHQLARAKADGDYAVEHPDRRRNRPAGANRRLRREPHLHPHPGWETMGDQGSFERHDGVAFVEGSLHFRGDSEQFRHIRGAHAGTAPSWATQRAAASSPSSIPPTMNPAASASPAPVVSTTEAPSEACSSEPPSACTSTPLEPRLTTAVSPSP